jgi:cytochrome c-type biogenesis protein CcmE
MMNRLRRRLSILRKVGLGAALAAAIILAGLGTARQAFGYPESVRDAPAPAARTATQAAEPYDAQTVGDPDIAIAYVGADAELQIEVRNTGQETWRAGQVVLSNLTRPLNAETTQILAADVPPGQSTTWQLRVRAPDNPGAYRSEWQLKQAGQAFGPTLTAYLIVLPEGASELEEKIRAKIDEWRQQAEHQIDDLIDEVKALIVAEVRGFLEKLVDDLRGNLCGASALILFGALLLWWRKS